MTAKPSYEELEQMVLELEDTKRKLRNTENALRDSKAQLHAFFNYSPVGFGLWDRDLSYVYINEVLRKINGPSLEEHIGHSVEEVLPDASHIIRPIFEGILSSCRPVLNIELSGVIPSRPDVITHYLVSYFPVSIIDGHPQYIGGVVHDITARKQMEDDLQASEKKYRELIELAQEGIWLIDKDHNTTFANPSMARMLGYASDEMTGKHLFYFMDEAAIEIANANLERRQKGIVEQHDFEFLRKDGQRIITTMQTAPVLDEDGNYRGAIAGVLDITKRRESEQEKKGLQVQLAQAQKMESIGNLAGGIAHEFNNMLAIIMGNNELIMEELPQGSLARENTEKIRIAGLRARDVVKQLLTFSRHDDTVKKVMDFTSVVQESMKLIRSSTPANIKIEQKLSANTYPIIGNQTQINQLLINLCNNSIDALPETGGTISIELLNATIDIQQTKHQTKLNPGQYAKLMVSDNGIGMDTEVLERVFEPYFTTKNIGEGTGIGMAVVHGIVERHGGAIAVDSKPGQGTTFTIFFPAHEGLLEQETEGQDILPVGDECILYVDDEPSLATLGKRLLERFGYTAVSITDPVKALDMVRADPNRFDLLITDMAMPNMTGEQLVIETLKIRQNMPIIICTGYSAKISEKEAMDIGVRSYIMKPINKSELAKMVRMVLDEAKRSDLEKP